MPDRPWEVGDDRQRWNGYLDERYPDYEAGAPVMRNLVGAQTYAELRWLEDAHVARRAMTLRAQGIPASYDLDGLRQVHRHLFQDVYEWAGELRTVNMAKSNNYFQPFDRIEARMARVSEALVEVDNFRGASDRTAALGLALVYNEVNATHAFREGNGRTQREFLSAIAAESGRRIDWTKVQGRTNNEASELGRRGDMRLLNQIFPDIVSRIPDAQPKTPLQQAKQALEVTQDRRATRTTQTPRTAPDRDTTGHDRPKPTTGPKAPGR